MKHSPKAWLHLKSFISSPMAYIAARRDYRYSASAQRWHDASNLHERWDERTLLMASHIKAGSSVFEFGAGRQVLKANLPSNCRYTASDIIAHTPDMLSCDLNHTFPQLNQSYDYMVLSGVIEYIQNVPSLMHNIYAHCGECIVSYAPIDFLSCMITRQQSGFINHLSETQLLALFREVGFTVESITPIWTNQRVYHLKNHSYDGSLSVSQQQAAS